MPLPLVPIALTGTAALAAWRVLRAVRPGRTDQRAEDALDDLDEGVAAHAPRDRDQRNVAVRVLRSVRVGARRYTLDAALIGRVRLRRG
jgi:hypothetical protein